MKEHQKTDIIITGMKHSGKTTHGKLLARRLNCPFIDTDELIEVFFEKRYNEKLSCREIYIKRGGEFFREIEHIVMESLLSEEQASAASSVISLGGGLIANAGLQPILHKIGFLVYLKVHYDVLYKRIVANGIPPFLEGPAPFEHFISLCNERERYYVKYSDLTIDLEDLPLKDAHEVVFNDVISSEPMRCC